MPWHYALTICAAALVLGIAGYGVTGSAGSMAATAGFAVGLFAALSLGVRGLHSSALPHAYWIVIVFLSRCLTPMQDKPGILSKYGHGAAIGVLVAIAIELLGTPDGWRLLLALAAFVLCLRFMLHPLPISAAAMTAGILLVSAPTPTAAIFRAEIVLLVITLILFLTLILEQIVPRIPEAKPAKPDV